MIKWKRTFCVTKLKIPHYFSRVKMPKDNAINERFNRTLREEFIQLGNFTTEPLLFNQRLTEWLIEYDFNRPHQSLDYLSPIEYLNNYQKGLHNYFALTHLVQGLDKKIA